MLSLYRSRRNALIAVAVAPLLLLRAGDGGAQPQQGVDTALILAVDVSNSVDARRYRLQTGGIADALDDPAVQATILGGPRGAIAISVILWADRPHFSIPWVRITSAADAKALAGRVRRLARQGGEFTCVAQMMRFVADKITPQIPVKATRVVLDVSGDGQENCNPGLAPAGVRDELVGLGLTINGLPILEGGQAATLAGWYRDNVIGGAGRLSPAGGELRGFRPRLPAEIHNGDQLLAGRSPPVARAAKRANAAMTSSLCRPLTSHLRAWLRLQLTSGGCRLRPLSFAKAGHDLERPIMRKWKKPAIIEVSVGCEVTSYAPAQL